MAIKKTPSGTYEARWRPPGSRVVKSKRFKLKKDAVTFMAKIEAAKRDGTYTDLTRGKQTLEEWWREYFAHSVALRPSTREHYRRLAELHVLPHLGRRALGTITESEIKGWMSTLQKRGVGAATINAAHRVLRTVLNVAVKERVIGRNPAVGGSKTQSAARCGSSGRERFTPSRRRCRSDTVPSSCCLATVASTSGRPPL